MFVSIGADHGGFNQKDAIVEHLRNDGIEVIDHGTDSDASVDYPDFARLVADDVASGVAEFGILICGTGIGMSIAANKVKGIRAANIINEEFAKLSREHNNANVITLSGRFVSLDENIAILKTFLATPFGGDRHERRVNKIHALEG